MPQVSDNLSWDIAGVSPKDLRFIWKIESKLTCAASPLIGTG
jgi:hypothetical protein